jgi:uncharacterized integral membrane protein
MNRTLQRSKDDSHAESRKRVSRWTYFKLLLTLMCFVTVVVILFQNAEAVRVELLFWRMEMSMALVVFFSLLIGAAIGASVCGRIVWKRS